MCRICPDPEEREDYLEQELWIPENMDAFKASKRKEARRRR